MSGRWRCSGAGVSDVFRSRQVTNQEVSGERSLPDLRERRRTGAEQQNLNLKELVRRKVRAEQNTGGGLLTGC